MAAFEVIVHRARMKPHPDANAIEICLIGGYQSVVAMGQIKDGDIVAYIPEASILPDNLIEKMGLTGKLAGKEANRITPLRLRGVVSQGLVYPMPHRREGDDVTGELGITKYLPSVPEHMQGQVYNASGMTVHYDVENIKKYPKLLLEGEEVIMTEKVHGTQCQMGRHRGQPIVTSKTYGAHGQALELNDENRDNIYVQMYNRYASKLESLAESFLHHPEGPHHTFYLIGELYGRGVQDLSYDTARQEFRVFDVYLGYPRTGRFLDYDEMTGFLKDSFDTVPLIYRGPYSKETMLHHTQGQSLMASHQREGVVVKPVIEREAMRPGRVILKSISDRHLLRKGNPTEFE